ncbi:hypothetical protein [Streptomyces sp. NPDC020571]|uniref:hypothetical protein n=1 Tax=Streptomyces sp. NPDC020571 TaxID=3365079 RepID=UPI0037A577E6
MPDMAGKPRRDTAVEPGTTAEPQPGTTAEPQPDTTAGPGTTARRGDPGRSGAAAGARSEPGITAEPEPAITAEPGTTAGPRPGTSARRGTTAGPGAGTTARSEPGVVTAEPEPGSTAAAPPAATPVDASASTSAPAAAVGPLLPADELDRLGERLHRAVAGFVDAPRASVEEADRVLEEVAARFTDAVTHHRRTLRTAWQEAGPDSGAPSTDTEQLRLALRDYRELADRLMRV